MGSSCAVGLSRALLPSESVYLSRRSHQFIRRRSSLGCFAVQGLASQRYLFDLVETCFELLFSVLFDSFIRSSMFVISMLFFLAFLQENIKPTHPGCSHYLSPRRLFAVDRCD
ncbi:hypothetical protein BHE74_00035922 [Ensete ventricosum]|nr:hypothetical protein GW17_00003135 [Ensete ventricosum]RWW57302.1 hypothetical protein BHE74_00035922 [Ensete ventricosum]RZR98795.1 hypothetical protein BHM03_00028239 [Ensete ventricosum]